MSNFKRKIFSNFVAFSDHPNFMKQRLFTQVIIVWGKPKPKITCTRDVFRCGARTLYKTHYGLLSFLFTIKIIKTTLIYTDTGGHFWPELLKNWNLTRKFVLSTTNLCFYFSSILFNWAFGLNHAIQEMRKKNWNHEL